MKFTFAARLINLVFVFLCDFFANLKSKLRKNSTLAVMYLHF